jgi:hypothetical protein
MVLDDDTACDEYHLSRILVDISDGERAGGSAVGN